MPAYTSPGGIIVRAATDETADLQSVLKGMLDGSRGGTGLNTQTIPKFPSYAALAAAFPAPTDASVPSLAYVLNDKHYQWVGDPYDLFAPLPGFVVADSQPGRSGVTPSVTGVGATFGITDSVSLPVFAWPTISRVTFRTVLSAGVGTDLTDTYVLVNGAGTAYFRVNGTGSSSVTFNVVNEGSKRGAPATTLQGLMAKVTGAGTTVAVSADARYTVLDWETRPYYAEVGS